MFSSVHFLFLLSLGAFSWAILCYFSQIGYLMNSSKSEDIFSTTKMSEEINIPSPSGHQKAEFYVQLLCVFTCIYALAKVIHIAERYLAKEMCYNLNILNKNQFEGTNITPEIKQKNLMAKIETLEKENVLLKQKLREKRMDPKSNVTYLGDAQQNIYISNQHYRLCVKECKNADSEAGAANDIWQNYLQMQKVSCKRPALASLWIDSLKKSHPIVSTEELQALHGLI